MTPNTLTTCPREGCTATARHWHDSKGAAANCPLSTDARCAEVHAMDDPREACYLPRTPAPAEPQPYRFPDGWERGHEAKYWAQTGLTPYGLTLDPERAPGVLNWLGVNYYTPDSPHLPKPDPREACYLPRTPAPAEPQPLDHVDHPSHYTSHPSGVECIEVVEHFGFCVGNAIKYLWRAGLKGDTVEDLKKARWYVEREIARREADA